VIQKFSDKPVTKCPKCGKQVERLLSSPAIQFKGTGWYVTDYAKRSGPTDTPGDSKNESKSEKDSAKETPPAAASENKTKESSNAKSAGETPKKKSRDT
jgi:predicted nucleic acid-binding Zn ribbon protein